MVFKSNYPLASVYSSSFSMPRDELNLAIVTLRNSGKATKFFVQTAKCTLLPTGKQQDVMAVCRLLQVVASFW